MGWSGGIHKLGFIAQRRFQERKGGIWETDSIGDIDGKKIRHRLGEEEDALTSGPAVSAREIGEMGKHRRARKWACCRLGPSGEARSGARAWEQVGCGEGLGCRSESKEEK
jgi:hypothetical protein